MRALDQPVHAKALADAAAAAADGLQLKTFATSRNLVDADYEAIIASAEGTAIGTDQQTRLFNPAHWQNLTNTLVETLAHWHREHPDQVGLAAVQLIRHAGYRFPDRIAQAIASKLEHEDRFVRERLGYRLPSHQPGLQGEDAALWQKVAAAITEDGLRPGSLADIAAKLAIPERRLQSFLTAVGRHGHAHRISNTRYLTQTQLSQLRVIAEDVAAKSSDGTLDVRAFRDASTIGRNMAIEVLEYFDKIGFTRRRGDLREIKRKISEDE